MYEMRADVKVKDEKQKIFIKFQTDFVKLVDKVGLFLSGLQDETKYHKSVLDFFRIINLNY